MSRIGGGLSQGAGSGGGGGGFEWPPYDWAADAGGFGVGAADFPVPVDLATIDGGAAPIGPALAVVDRSADNKHLRIRPTPVADIGVTIAGAVVFDVADLEDGCWALRILPRMTASAAATATPGTSFRAHFGAALYRAADLSGGWTGALLRGDGASPAGMGIVSATGTSRKNYSAAASAGAGSWMLGDPLDVFIMRTGSQVELAYGRTGSVMRFSTVASGHSGPGVIGVIAATETIMHLDVLVVRAVKLAGLPVGP